MEPVPAVADFVATHFPDALVAFVGGSVLTADRTETSDLDVVVLLDGPPAPFRATYRHAGWVVEAFVQTRESLALYSDHDAARRVPSLLRMCGESEVVVDRCGLAAGIQAEARREVTGKKAPVEFGPRRPGDAIALYADPTRAHQILGWEAKHKDPETIIRSAWNWFSKHPKGYDDHP